MIYLSGPITNNPDFRTSFAEAEKLCREMFNTNDIFNPSVLRLHKSAGWLDYMLMDLYELRMSETVIFLEGWEQSKGCMVEKICAEQTGKNIFYIKNGGIYADVRK